MGGVPMDNSWGSKLITKTKRSKIILKHNMQMKMVKYIKWKMKQLYKYETIGTEIDHSGDLSFVCEWNWVTALTLSPCYLLVLLPSRPIIQTRDLEQHVRRKDTSRVCFPKPVPSCRHLGLSPVEYFLPHAGWVYLLTHSFLTVCVWF